jgi:hypothetical protein
LASKELLNCPSRDDCSYFLFNLVKDPITVTTQDNSTLDHRKPP